MRSRRLYPPIVKAWFATRTEQSANISGENRSSGREPELPPRPPAPEVRISQNENDLRLVYRPSQGQFLGVIACLMLLGYLLINYVLFVVQDGPDEWHPAQIGFVLLWSLIGIALVGICLMGFFGTEQVTLGQSGLRYERRVILRLRCLFVPLSDIKDIRVGIEKLDDDFPRDVFFVEFDIGGHCPLRFAFDIEAKEQIWLVALLKNHLLRLHAINRRCTTTGAAF